MSSDGTGPSIPRSVARPPLLPFHSSIEGIVWPPLVGADVGQLAALVSYLDASQWLPPEELRARALIQLVVTAAHCVRESPLFAKRMRLAGLSPNDLGEPGGLQKLPPMTRRQIQEAGDSFYCRLVPPEHKPVREGQTSGSTGEPITIRHGLFSTKLWHANNIRDHLWHRRDFSGRAMNIRARFSKPIELASWGPPSDLLFETGPSFSLPIATAPPAQAAQIRAFKPNVLLTYANNLSLLIDELAKTGSRPPDLKHLRTMDENVTPELRERALDYFGLPLEDVYSSTDSGTIALHCPECGRYHVMAETLIVEIVNEKGEPCSANEIGRVLVTDVTNFATPIIRYAIGDYAEVGETGQCGRGLPALNRILGRDRNLLVLPDGSRRWPIIGMKRYREVAPVLQYQLVQETVTSIDVHLVVARPLSKAEEKALGQIIVGALGSPFRLTFRYHEGTVPRGPRGKFEEFVSRVRA